MLLPILKIFENDIVGPYGKKKKFDIYVMMNGAEFKFESFKGMWNGNWNIGAEIEVPELSDSRWKVRDYQGKTYYTLGAPPEASQQSGGSPQYSPRPVAPIHQTPSAATPFNNVSVEQKLDLIISLLSKNPPNVPNSTVSGTEDIPVIQDETPPSGPIM